VPRDPLTTPLVLAAGASRRMGRPKAALPFGATTALGRILAACHAAGLGRPVVVTGAAPAAVAGAAAGADVRFAPNPEWARGRTTSIQAGLRALPAAARAFLLWPVDVCLPGAAVVRALQAARAADPDRLLAWVPSHAGRRGHPVLTARPVAARRLALGPDEPARAVVRALAAEGALAHVEVAEDGVLLDVNTPEEYRRLRGRVARSG